MYKVRIQINQTNTQISNYFDLVSNKTKNVRGVGKMNDFIILELQGIGTV